MYNSKLTREIMKMHAARAEYLTKDTTLDTAQRVNDPALTRLADLCIKSSMAALVDAPTWYHERGLMQTATGYGSKLVTPYKLKLGRRKYRVYSVCYSNCSTEYILFLGKRLIIDLSDYSKGGA